MGEVDLVYVPSYVSNLVYAWETPYWRGFYERLAERFRLILFDKRGTGLSDLGGQFPVLETRMDDVRAVLDAVGSSQRRLARRTRRLLDGRVLRGDLPGAHPGTRPLPPGRP